MKYVYKSSEEPEALKRYRDEAPKSTWDQLRGERPDCYQSIRDQIRKDQGGLCAYCELGLDIDNEQIAHFHPKRDINGNKNWALEWENLWLACKGGSQTWMTDGNHYLPPLPENLSCDEKKGNEVLDEIILAPKDVPISPRIFRYEQYPDHMLIKPDNSACEEAHIEVEFAQKTIDALNLNCSRLGKARLKVHSQLEQAVKKLRESGYDPKEGLIALVKKHLQKDAEGRWPSFFTVIRWRFTSHAENYLNAINFRG